MGSNWRKLKIALWMNLCAYVPRVRNSDNKDESSLPPSGRLLDTALLSPAIDNSMHTSAPPTSGSNCHRLRLSKNLSGLLKQEVVGEVVEVGSDVTKFGVGDCVGVGIIVGCCRNCRPCKANIEQYCNKKIWTYNDVYIDGKPTEGGFSGAMVVDQKMLQAMDTFSTRLME